MDGAHRNSWVSGCRDLGVRVWGLGFQVSGLGSFFSLGHEQTVERCRVQRVILPNSRGVVAISFH